MNNEHLSYSQIFNYIDCSRRWQANYQQDIKNPNTESLAFGKVGHSVVENYIRDKSRDMLEMWGAAWTEYLTTEESKTIVWDETPDVCRAAGERLFSSADVTNLLSGINPKFYAGTTNPMIEREIHWTLKDMPDIIGYIDLICDDGVPLDFKTASRMWPADKAQKEMQPLFYLAALNQLGEYDHDFRFRHIVMTKTLNPRIEMFETIRTAREIEFMENIVRQVWKGISSGIFIPNPMSWLCDPKSCGAYSICVGAK